MIVLGLCVSCASTHPVPVVPSGMARIVIYRLQLGNTYWWINNKKAAGWLGEEVTSRYYDVAPGHATIRSRPVAPILTVHEGFVEFDLIPGQTVYYRLDTAAHNGAIWESVTPVDSATARGQLPFIPVEGRLND